MMEGAGEKGLILIDEFQSIVKNSDEFMEELTSFVQKQPSEVDGCSLQFFPLFC